MITATKYNYPTGITDGYFKGKTVPKFPDYISNYHVYFMRYIYYMCIMNSEGEYPVKITIEEIQDAFEKNKGENCNRRIKKILIGEAPPPNLLNYFYNPSIARWNVAKGNPTTGQGWTSTIKNTLFPGMVFSDTISFLKECAKEGILLLDLFPYSIAYSGTDRKSRKYKEACINAWGFGTHPYHHNIKDTLDYLDGCIQKPFSLGFALKSFGEIISDDAESNSGFEMWSLVNGISLTPPGPINQTRLVPAPFPSASIYLRVCGIPGPTGPNSSLLSIAGF